MGKNDTAVIEQPIVTLPTNQAEPKTGKIAEADARNEAAQDAAKKQSEAQLRARKPCPRCKLGNMVPTAVGGK